MAEMGGHLPGGFDPGARKQDNELVFTIPSDAFVRLQPGSDSPGNRIEGISTRQRTVMFIVGLEIIDLNQQEGKILLGSLYTPVKASMTVKSVYSRWS